LVIEIICILASAAREIHITHIRYVIEFKLKVIRVVIIAAAYIAAFVVVIIIAPH